MRNTADAFDVVIVGAGFAGLYMLHRLRGLGMSAKIFEAGDDLGGTWYWNRYPGARCDVESMQYSYSFDDALQQEWRWSERYAAQPEILRYAGHVADRFDLRRDIQFNARVVSAVFDEQAVRWQITTDQGDKISAQYCVMATGCLSAGRKPDIAGIESFAGPSYHTGEWPHEGVDFTGQRVGIIGTGSSAIQSIPVIAAQAAHLTVFQRTPNFSVPAHNGPLSEEHERDWKSRYHERRQAARVSSRGILYEAPLGDKPALAAAPEEREREFAERWKIGGLNLLTAYNDLLFDKAANETAAAYVRARIREMVRDPAVAAKLMPTNHPIGTKRVCVDTGYYETYNRDNITLVDLNETPIVSITPTGVQTHAQTFAFDSLVFATGFDAMTGALLRIDIRGRNDLPLRDKWEAGPRTYLGLMTAGFPNMFTVTGPGSPSVLSNMMVSIEQHIDWITDCLRYLGTAEAACIEARTDAEDAWVEHVNEVAHSTLYPQANSWYMGANIPGKPRVFMPYVGGVGAYRKKCDEVAAAGYEGFVVTRPETVRAAAE
jgi:cyclohexanone monooxygenase